MSNYSSKFKKLCGLCNLQTDNFYCYLKESVLRNQISQAFLLSVSNSLLPQGTGNKAEQFSVLSPLSAPIHVKHWGAELQLFLKNGALGTQRESC